MADPGLQVLLVVGSEDVADFAARALAHPRIDIIVAGEETLVGLLGTQPFNLAVVGGTVGTRGPLNLCEAVRMSQQVPVLILVGPETSEMAIGHHRKRDLQGVYYLDIEALQQPDGSLVDLGKQLRGEALTMLSLEDDEQTGAAYFAALDEAQAARDAAAAPAEEATPEQPEPAQHAESTVEGVAAEEDPISDAPPFRAQLTDEDLEFAARVIEKTKSVDFRAAMPQSGPPVDAAEAKTRQLRDRIRELEKQQARFAFVYRSRKKLFDAAAESITALEQSRVELEAALQAQQLQQQQAEQQHGSARREQEQQFSGMLTQAQHAFEELREQSGRAIEQGRTDFAAKQAEVENLTAQLAQLQAQLEVAVAAQTELQSQAQQERQQLLDSQAQADRVAAQSAAATGQQLQQDREGWAAERGNLIGQVEALTGENQTLRQEFDRSRDETAAVVSQLGELRMQSEQREASYGEDVRKVQELLSQTEAAWMEKHTKLKESATTFRDAYQEHEAKIRDQQATIDGLNAQLQARGRAVENLERDAGLDKRLGAIETAQKSSTKDLGKALDKVRSQLATQETLLEVMATAREPRQKGGDVEAPAHVWITAKPKRLAGAAGMLVLFTVLLVIAIIPRSSAAPAADDDRRQAAAALDVVDAAAPTDEGGEDPATERTAADEDAAEPEVADESKSESEGAVEDGADAAAAAAAEEEEEEVAADDAAAQESAAPSAGSASGDEEGRKKLRKKMLKAHTKRRWSESAQLGEQLRRDYRLDWETEFKLGEAHQRAGDLDLAVKSYDSFVGTYPDNAFADDAMFRAGSIRLAQKKPADARTRLTKVAGLKGSPWASKAKSLLRKIK